MVEIIELEGCPPHSVEHLQNLLRRSVALKKKTKHASVTASLKVAVFCEMLSSESVQRCAGAEMNAELERACEVCAAGIEPCV